MSMTSSDMPVRFGRFPVVMPAVGDDVVDASLMVDVRGGFDQVHERRPELAERTDRTLTLFDRPGIAAADGDGRPEVQFPADSWPRRDRPEPNDVA